MRDRKRGRLPQADPRVIAGVAILLALAAIALEIAYTVGHFVMTTFGRFG